MRHKQAWVYSGELNTDTLRRLVASLPDRIVLSWDLARLDFPQTVEARQAGCAFNREIEVRWEVVSGDLFRVLVLSDREQRANLPQDLKPVEGEWRSEETVILLVDLENDKQFSPQFRSYPCVSQYQAHLKCRILLRNGIVTFVSPREVFADAEKV